MPLQLTSEMICGMEATSLQGRPRGYLQAMCYFREVAHRLEISRVGVVESWMWPRYPRGRTLEVLTGLWD